MASLDKHLRDPDYANWIKNTMGLKITQEVLKAYLHRELPAIQTLITKKGPQGVVCSLCNVKGAPNCQKNVCNVYHKEIINNHRNADPSFRNTNAKKWKTDAWEIAKCFMPQIAVHKHCTLSDVDFSGVIHVIINCKHFDALVSCNLNQPGNIFCEAKKMRNMLMHADCLKVSDANLLENLELLASILTCFNDRLASTAEGLKQIEKLKMGELKITLQDVLDARKQAFLAMEEGMDNGKKKMNEFADLCIARIRQEIEKATPIWPALQHRLIGNFIKGCKYSLIRLVQCEIESVRPKRYSRNEWNLTLFLNKIELSPDIVSLFDRHKCFLYPEDGSPSDITTWDIFLLCHILSLKTRDDKPTYLKNYVLKLQKTRDKILDNPGSIREEDLKRLIDLLADPLKTDVKSVYAGKGVTDDATQLQSVLESWQNNEDKMKISIQTLEQAKAQAREIARNKIRWNITCTVFQTVLNSAETPENKKEFDKMRQLLGSSESDEEGDKIETCAEIQVKNLDPEEEEEIQSNISSEDSDINISLAGGGMIHFQEQLNLETAKTVKGCIILKVTCKSIKNLIRFWDSCIDGSAVKALSKIRDDYRKRLGFDTLEFDIVLREKEVHRCMNHLAERMPYQPLDENILKAIQANLEVLQTVQVKAMDLTRIMMEFCTKESLPDLLMIEQ